MIKENSTAQRLFLAFLLCCVLSSRSLHAEGFAIVVGVNKCPRFRLPSGAKPRRLRGAEHDADAMAKLLHSQFGFDERNIHLLKGRNATFERLKSTFLQVAKNAQGEDSFLFHFSGHGTQVSDPGSTEEPDNLDEALCLFDCTAKGKNLLLDDVLHNWLAKISARNIVVTLDCCHAGTGTKVIDDDLEARFLPIVQTDAPAKDNMPWREASNAARPDTHVTAFFACQANQLAFERRFLQLTPPRKHGQFTYFWIEGLTGNAADSNGDGVVSSRELFQHTTRRLNATFNKKRRAAKLRQTPALDPEPDKHDLEKPLIDTVRD